MVAVLVLGDVEAFDAAVGAARGDHRDLALERHKGFEDAGLGADLAPSGYRVGAVADRHLPLAVIAVAAGFEHCWPAGAGDSSGQLRRVVDRRGRPRAT